MLYMMATFFIIHSGLAWSFGPIEPSIAWDKPEVIVCWGNNNHKAVSSAHEEADNFIEYSKEQKAWIQDIVTAEYNMNDLGISFIGWNDCDATASKADVILLRFQKDISGEELITMRGGAATMGQNGIVGSITDPETSKIYPSYLKRKATKLNVVIINTTELPQKKLNNENYIKLLALHEFGHTTGLRHEHVRTNDALKDPNCLKFKKMLKQEGAYHTTVFSGEYDHNSVMNYCYINKLNDVAGLTFNATSAESVMKLTDTTLYQTSTAYNMWGRIIEKKLQYNLRIGLSALDKHGIRCLYKNEEESKIQSCNVSM